MGNCSYMGVIPVKAITRVSIFDPKSNREMALTAADPTISIVNYRFCADKYRALVRWLMGETVSAEDMVLGQFFNDEHREQVEAMLANQQVEIITLEPEPKWHMVTCDLYLGSKSTYRECRAELIANHCDNRKRPVFKRIGPQVYEYEGQPDEASWATPGAYIGTREGLASIGFRDLDSMQREAED